MSAARSLSDTPRAVPATPVRFTPGRARHALRVTTGRSWAVRRADLLARLARRPDRRLIVLTAPSGYGKTTLLTQWAQECGRPCAWVRLDGTIDTGERLQDVIAGAMMAAGIAPGDDRSFTLVLDDADALRSADLWETVLDVLDGLPAGSQLAIASRHQAQLPLGRLRAQRMLIELGAGDLAMSGDESASLISSTGLDPQRAPVQMLLERADGWPVALELAGLSSLARADAVERAPFEVRGDDHVIAEYFRAEILAGLAPAEVHFLIRTSVLDRLSGPLCDAVLACSGSAEMLAGLDRANVPLAALDPGHEWFGLHAMFREMLQAELRRTEPGSEPSLHHRASVWFGAVGDVDRALDHAAGAGDADAVAQLVWDRLPRYLGEGRAADLERWVTAVDHGCVAGSARLALTAAHTSLALGALAAAEQWTRTVAVNLAQRPDEATDSERAGALIIEAWGARAGARAMGESAAEAYRRLAEDDPWRASCCLLRGSAALLTGDLDGADRWLEEGACRGALLAPDAAGMCLAQLAVAAIERGQADTASDLAARARAIGAAHGLDLTSGWALVWAADAAAAVHVGRVDEAKAAAAQCRNLLELYDDAPVWLGAETRILLARTSLRLGELATARALLADASRLSRRVREAVVFERWFDAAWDQFDQRAETALAGAASLTTAELRVLRFLPTHYSFAEIAERLHVSANTVKTHVHAVYRKLDASSRSEAVAHATAAGLLGG